MYSVRQDLMLQSVFRDKERPTLIQFSFLKTRVFSAFPKLLFFFCVQFSNHAPDMSIERVSFPFLFRGFYSFVFRCIFSLCVLGEVVLLMVFCHVSCLGLPKFSSEPTVRTELPELNCQFKFSSGSGSDDSRQFRFAVRALRKF